MNNSSIQVSSQDRILEFHDVNRLRQTVFAVVPSVEASLPEGVTNEMRVDAVKPFQLFASNDIWFFEAGGWRMYFDNRMNLQYIQYYRAAAAKLEGVRLIADIDNRQLEWHFGGITDGKGLKPSRSETADVYVVRTITLSTLVLAADGKEATVVNEQIKLTH